MGSLVACALEGVGEGAAGGGDDDVAGGAVGGACGGFLPPQGASENAKFAASTLSGQADEANAPFSTSI